MEIKPRLFYQVVKILGRPRPLSMSRSGLEHPTFRMRGKRSNHMRHSLGTCTIRIMYLSIKDHTCTNVRKVHIKYCHLLNLIHILTYFYINENFVRNKFCFPLLDGLSSRLVRSREFRAMTSTLVQSIEKSIIDTG